MRKTIFVLAITLVAIFISTWGLAAGQSVSVVVPARASIRIDDPDVTFNFPTLDQWTSDTNTQTSKNYTVRSYLNSINWIWTNPTMVVSSTPLTNQSGAQIPLSGFRVYYSSNGGAESSATLDQVARFPRIGLWYSNARVRYDLTVDAAQPSGRYTGVVTFTLVNN